MFSTSQLSESDRQRILEWVEAGNDMASLQVFLKEELGHNLTYMDTRFLALDLGLEFKKEEVPEPDPVEEVVSDLEDLTNLEAAGNGTVQVTVDQIARPGALISGRVTFSDGEKSYWLIDQMGRPSIDPDTPGYRPSEPDLMEFQQALREAIEGGARGASF